MKPKLNFITKFIIALIAVFSAWIAVINYLLFSRSIIACIILDLLAGLIILMLWRCRK